MSRRDALDQLSSFRTRVDDDARARDLEAIRTELLRTTSKPARARRRWALAVMVAMLAAGPAAALAAGDALPGDLLYPVKRFTEPIVRLFDGDVVAEHRVEEVADLVQRNADDDLIRERIEMARDALVRTEAPDLEDELERIVDRWITDRTPEPDRTGEPSPTTTMPARPAGTVDRSDDDRQLDVPESVPHRTTTTTTPRDTDRPPPDDRPRDTP